MSSGFRRVAASAFAAILISVVAHAARPAAKQGAAWTSQLRGVDADGSKRIPVAQIAAIAALKIGTTIGPNDVEAARQRLLKSGYFRSVGYSFRNAGYGVVLTFSVEDVAWSTPVVFDNFVDHTDAQLIAAIAKDVPSFDGIAPDNEIVLRRIGQTLERLAREAQDPGPVTYALILGQLGANRWQFRIERTSGPLPVCSIAFEGLSESSVPTLADRKAALIGEDYSKDRILKFAKATFGPLLPSPMTVRQVDARRAPVTQSCPRGAAVTIKVN